jgi:hypothetical protein
VKVPDYEDLANHVFPSHAPRAVKPRWSVSRGARTSHWAMAERYPRCRFVHTEGNAAERDTCGCCGAPAWSETLARRDTSYLRTGRYLAWLVLLGKARRHSTEFRLSVIDSWRRGYKNASTRNRMKWIADAWVRRPRIFHQWPGRRFHVSQPRRSCQS